MNIFNKVTLKTLSKNRTRTIVTIIGIILSTSMFTAVTTFISSLQVFMINSIEYIGGDWHGCTLTADYETAEQLRSDEGIEWVSVSQNLGYADLPDDDEMYKKYFYVLGNDQAFSEHIPVRITDGRMYENPNEIVMSSTYLSGSDCALKIGDTITLDLGQRYPDENSSVPLARYVSSDCEFINADLTRTYTIVGAYTVTNDSITTSSYYALTMYDDTLETRFCDIYFGAVDPTQTYGIIDSISSGYIDNNSDLLMMYGVSKYVSYFSVLYSLAAILIALIMLGSVSLIYNAFSISVSQRTKQFGLLSSVGATRRQIRGSVFFEAFAVSIIGIPLGLLAGISGIGVTLMCLSGAFASLFVGDIPFGLTLDVNPPSILIAAGIALITVLISAWIPSARAKRISAIDAIRQSWDIKVNKKNYKASRLTYKLFGIGGVLASKHFRRNKKSYRATIISLFMSIVLFVSSSSFCAYLSASVNGVYGRVCDAALYYVTEDSFSQRDLDVYKTACGFDGIDDKLLMSTNDISAEFDQSAFTEEYLEYCTPPDGENAELSVVLMIIDDESFKKYAESIGENPAGYLESETLKGILCEYITYIDYENEKYANKEIIDGELSEVRLNVSKWEINDDYSKGEEKTYSTTVSVGAVTNQYPEMTGGNYTSPRLYVPASAFLSCKENNEALDKIDNQFYCRFKTSQHAELTANLEKLLNTVSGTVYGAAIDAVAHAESSNNIVMIISVFSYGFITLISLIAAANVFNTISTNITLRRREFAMLKSVGMTKRGFNSMMNYECMLYGLKALLYGLPVSVGITYLIFLSINNGWETSFFIPWQAVAIAVFSVFAVVFATMLYSMRKIKKDNPIEALRNENI